MDSSLKYKALVDIAKVLNADIQLGEEDIFELIYQQASEKLGMQNLSIALFDEKTDTVRFVLAYSDGMRVDIGKEQGWESRPSCNGKTERIIRSKRHLYLRSRKEVEEAGYRPERKPDSWLGVPMIFRERVIGVIATYHYGKSDYYTDNDIEILKALADVATIALQNLRLHSAEVENERNLLRTLIDTMPDIIYIKDCKSRFILANKMAAEFMGGNSWRELIGKTDHDFHSTALADKYRSDEEKIINSLEPMINKEEISQHLITNEWIWFLSTKVPFKDAEGKIAGILGINRDITLRKRAEKELNIYKERLEELVTDRTEKLNVAYEISKAAIVANNLESLYEKIHETIGKLMFAKNFRIVTFDSDAKISGTLYFRDERDQTIEKQKEVIENGLTSHVFKTSEPLILTSEIRNSLIKQNKIKDFGTYSKSWMGVPLQVQGGENANNKKTIGVITVHSYDEEDLYRESEKDILTFVSEQIAMAIERVRVQEKLSKQNSQQKALIDLAQKLTSSIQLKEKDIFGLIHNHAKEIMDVDNMYMALYDEANYFVHFPLAFKNGSPTEIPARKAGGGRTEVIIRSKSPIFIQTRKESEEWYKQPGRSEYMGDPLASWLGVPMMIGERVLGVITRQKIMFIPEMILKLFRLWQI